MPRYRPRRHKPVLVTNISYLSDRLLEKVWIEIRPRHSVVNIKPSVVSWATPSGFLWSDGVALTSTEHP